jgi:hypothetical protein
MRNDSEVLDLFEGGQIFKAGVFNETGESVKFICLSSSPACGGGDRSCSMGEYR